jgi:hypothetical protein
VKELSVSQDDLQAIEDLIDEDLIRGTAVPDAQGIVTTAALPSGVDGRVLPTLKGRLFIEDQEAILRGRTLKGRFERYWPLILPILISIVSLLLSANALHRQTVQSKMDLWNSLRREFDHDLKNERRACGVAFENGEFDKEYVNVMDFFETVGFLVRTGRLDDDLFENTWSYDFAAYFKASEDLLNKDKEEDPTSYSDVFYLARKYIVKALQLRPRFVPVGALLVGVRDLENARFIE